MITDPGLVALADAKRLRELDLSGCRITDNGLKHIANAPGLKRLVLDRTSVTPKGIQLLRSALPECDIQYTAPAATRKTPK